VKCEPENWPHDVKIPKSLGTGKLPEYQGSTERLFENWVKLSIFPD
jgi:hypothetical protein